MRESACWLLLITTIAIVPFLRAVSVDASGWFGPEATVVLLFWTSFVPSFVAGLLAVAVGRPRKRRRVASLLSRWLPTGISIGALTMMVALVTFRLARGRPLGAYLHYQSGGGFFSPRHAVPAHVQGLLIIAGSWFGCASALSLWWTQSRSDRATGCPWRTARRFSLCWLLVAVASFAVMSRAGAPPEKAVVFGLFTATFSLGLVVAVALSTNALSDSGPRPKRVPVAVLSSAFVVAVLFAEATVSPLRIFW